MRDPEPAHGGAEARDAPPRHDRGAPARGEDRERPASRGHERDPPHLRQAAQAASPRSMHSSQDHPRGRPDGSRTDRPEPRRAPSDGRRSRDSSVARHDHGVQNCRIAR